MTIKKIINGLEFTKEMFLFDPSTGEEKTKEQLNDLDRTTVDACEGAIELLKQYTNTGGLISRDKVIEAIDGISSEVDEGYGFQYEKWRKYFCELPGVQESNLINVYGLEEEIRCTMCKNPNRTDRGCDGGCEYDERLYDTIIKVLNGRINNLPPVQPRVGKWIKDIEIFGDSAYHCDQCGAVLEKDDLEWRNNYYCYHCGAKMEDNKDE